MITYETARELKELGVEQTINTPNEVYYERDGVFRTGSRCNIFPRVLVSGAKIHSIPELKAAIHAEGWHCIEVLSIHLTSGNTSFRAKCNKHGVNDFTSIITKAKTEDEALAACLIQILEAKKPKTCGECEHFNPTTFGYVVCEYAPVVANKPHLHTIVKYQMAACPNFKESR